MSGWDEWDDRPDLPPEAGDSDARYFDPDDEWIKGADQNLQIEAMRQWFHARYQDPANDTPYIGREGGYLFIHGGPYDPNDVIQERFDKVVEYDVMNELIQELYQEVGDEWAPTESEWDDNDYYEAMSMQVIDRDDPYRFLKDRLDEIAHALEQNSTQKSHSLIRQLLHSASITALEAYLLDTFSYWVKSNHDILKRFVAKNPDFSKEKISLSTLFEAMDGLLPKINEYLQDFVWHRLDKVKPMMETTFGIEVPEIKTIMGQVVIRHHIVHRGGRDKEGDLVDVQVKDVSDVAAAVKLFADTLETALKEKFPPAPPGVLNVFGF